MDNRKNLVSGIVFFLFSLFIISIIPNQIIVANNEALNARTFPYWITIVMLISSVLQIIFSVYNEIKKSNYVLKEKLFNKLSYKKFFRFFVCIFILFSYVFFIDSFGFLVSTVFFVVSLMYFLGCKSFYKYLFTLMICISVYFIFSNVLLVQFPKGIML